MTDDADRLGDPPPVTRLVEAMLFVGGAPLTVERAKEAVRGLTDELFHECLEDLNRAYRDQGRPYRIQPASNGYELTLQPRYRSVAERMQGSPKAARLSPAALDVLALVAYRQPIDKQEVDSLRGAESGSQLRALVRLGLIALQRLEDGSGSAYSTTTRFLSFFHLRSLDELPRTQDLQRI